MIDINLLRMMKYKETFYKVSGRVPKEALEKTTVAVIEDFGKFFEKFPQEEVIDFDTFLSLFRIWHPKLSEEHTAAYQAIFTQAKTDIPDEKKQGIMQSLMELRLGSDLTRLMLEFEEGDTENIQGAIEDILTRFKVDAGIRSLDFLRNDIGDLLQQEVDDSGWRWRLDCLNTSMRGLRDGDFGIVAGRPDKGKTTFLASEMTYMAAQMPVDRTVLWLNNEGPGSKIIPRLYQAALGLKMSEMLELHKAGKLEEQYNEYMGMPWRIRVFDIHGLDNYAVERIVEQNNAGIVLYDMIDNVRGFGDAARTDLGLEKMYQWARELCVKYECAGIGTSQISNEGDGLMFPTMPMLKDSKTGKQGACDFQLMIGASNDIGLSRQRFIGLPKNKLRREGSENDPRATVAYKPERARYEDIPVTGDEIKQDPQDTE